MGKKERISMENLNYGNCEETGCFMGEIRNIEELKDGMIYE
jgi:hypothetical protein